MSAKPVRDAYSIDRLRELLREPANATAAASEEISKSLRQEIELERRILSAQERVRLLHETRLGLDATKRDAKKQRQFAEEIRLAKAEEERAFGFEHARQFLKESVLGAAFDRMKDDPARLEQFLAGASQQAFVLSLDLRGSTALMLKAKSPALFAKLVTTALGAIERCVKHHLGIFDKFSGDGVLALFPDDFSGPDAGLRALSCAREAAAIFNAVYGESASSFITVLADAGMGAGIDFGEVTMLRVCGAITALGTPVVYACRLGGAPKDCIYLNQGARDVLVARHPAEVELEKTTMEVKHEGRIVVYNARLKSAEALKFALPTWWVP